MITIFFNLVSFIVINRTFPSPPRRDCFNVRIRPSYKKSGLFSGFLELHEIFRKLCRICRDLEGFLEVLVNIFKVFCLFVAKKLET